MTYRFVVITAELRRQVAERAFRAVGACTPENMLALLDVTLTTLIGNGVDPERALANCKHQVEHVAKLDGRIWCGRCGAMRTFPAEVLALVEAWKGGAR